MTPAILTQQRLITSIREELGIHAAPARIRQWIRDGMPLAPSGGKKPRFVFAHVRDWLLGQSQPRTPLSQQIADHLFLRSCSLKLKR